MRSLADISTSKEDFDEEISIAGKALLDKVGIGTTTSSDKVLQYYLVLVLYIHAV